MEIRPIRSFRAKNICDLTNSEIALTISNECPLIMQKGCEATTKYKIETILYFSGSGNNFVNCNPGIVGMSFINKRNRGIPSGSILSGTKGIIEACPFNNQIVDLEIKSERQ
jgi:hypothetical protein